MPFRVPSQRAMRAYVIVSTHRLVRQAGEARQLLIGEQRAIAVDVAVRLDVSRSTAYRLVREALDVMGFGEPRARRAECWNSNPSAFRNAAAKAAP